MKKVVSYQTHVQSGRLLNANEMSNNISQTIISEIQEGIASIDFNRYPEDSCIELRKAYGQVMNIEPEKILAGNGSDQILGLLIGYYLSKGKILFTLSPDFGMYDYYCTSYDALICKYTTNEDGSFDVEDFVAQAKENNANMILFSNPNNPTGFQLSNEDIEKILKACSDIPVVIDEAYGEFASQSALKLVDQYSNLYVTRTLSKAYGLAGARVGFLISQQKNIEQIKLADVPYVLNSISQMVAIVVLRHADEFKELALKTIQARDSFYELKYKHLRLFKSQGNYIMVKPDNIDKLFGLFEQAGVVVRKYKNKDYFRLTIGNDEDNQVVKSIFDAYEKEEDNA